MHGMMEIGFCPRVGNAFQSFQPVLPTPGTRGVQEIATVRAFFTHTQTKFLRHNETKPAVLEIGAWPFLDISHSSLAGICN